MRQRADRPGRAEALGDGVEVEHLEGRGRGAQRVGDVVLADQAQLHRDARAPPAWQHEGRAAGVVEPHLLGPHVGGGACPASTHAGALAGARSRMATTRRSSALSTTSAGVVAVRLHRLDELALGLRDRLDRAELAEVRRADVELDRDVRAGEAA